MVSQVHQVVFWALRDILLLWHLRFGIRKESVRKRIYSDRHITFSRQWASLCLCNWRGRWATVRSSVDRVITQTFLRERSRCAIFTLPCRLTAAFHIGTVDVSNQNSSNLWGWKHMSDTRLAKASKSLKNNMALSSYSPIDLLDVRRTINSAEYTSTAQRWAVRSGESWLRLSPLSICLALTRTTADPRSVSISFNLAVAWSTLKFLWRTVWTD